MSHSHFKTASSPRPVRTWLLLLQRTLFVVGLVLVAVYASAIIHARVASRLALWAFAAAQEPPVRPAQSGDVNVSEDVDLSHWSTQRIAAYKSTLALKLDRPLAVLNIPRLRLTAPVFEGTDSLTLNRGLGRIHGTSMLGQDGNIGIAGHRDGFFRALRGVAIGDDVQISTPRGLDLYVVDRIKIVDPADVDVLKTQAGAELTLVTCYPFTFIGDAPRRYIVQASLKQHSL